MGQTAKRLHTAQDQEIVDIEHSRGAMTDKTLHCLLCIQRVLGKLQTGANVSSEIRRQVCKGTNSTRGVNLCPSPPEESVALRAPIPNRDAGFRPPWLA